MSLEPGPAETAPGVSLRALRPILPYALAHRGQIVASMIALVIASAATLVVPIAVRRMIDFGFSDAHAGLIHLYFLALIGVAAILGVASAARYYLVMTLGERIVAELRGDLFAHLTTLDPAYFDAEKTGEIISRLSVDTTQLKATFGSSASIALRNLFLFVGATVLMVATSLKLSAYVIGGANGARAFAPRPGHDRRSDRLRQREPGGGARDAGLRRREFRRQSLPRRRQRSLRGGSRDDAVAGNGHRGGAVPDFLERRRRAVARRQ
jgi:ABC-type multidrug transport system fused ATPase/permease subunit